MKHWCGEPQPPALNGPSPSTSTTTKGTPEMPTLEERIQVLEDREAIREVIANYCHGVDEHDQALFLSIWTEDAGYLIGEPLGDHHGLAAREHVRLGDMAGRLPLIGGHEGAGIVEEVGPGVTRVKPGDHIVCSYIPSCGYCRWCSTGQQNLCDMGATILDGCMPDGSFRFHKD